MAVKRANNNKVVFNCVVMTADLYSFYKTFLLQILKIHHSDHKIPLIDIFLTTKIRYSNSERCYKINYFVFRFWTKIYIFFSLSNKDYV
jgi:hypothetical protein